MENGEEDDGNSMKTRRKYSWRKTSRQKEMNFSMAETTTRCIVYLDERWSKMAKIGLLCFFIAVLVAIITSLLLNPLTRSGKHTIQLEYHVGILVAQVHWISMAVIFTVPAFLTFIPLASSLLRLKNKHTHQG
jgi:hypothetical protein